VKNEEPYTELKYYAFQKKIFFQMLVEDFMEKGIYDTGMTQLSHASLHNYINMG